MTDLLTTSPNVLWIGVDQMRADTLLNAVVQTPNLDRLRARLVELAQQHGDPVQNCIAKWFGQWRGLSGQPDVSSAYAVVDEGAP